MRLETFPLILAALVALVGLGLILDARLPDRVIAPNANRRDRRRAPRIDRHRGGETLVGIGILGLAAALAGRDSWRYSIVAAIAGAFFLLWGAMLNRQYLSTLLSNRGKLRRREGPAATSPRTPGGDKPPAPPVSKGTASSDRPPQAR